MYARLILIRRVQRKIMYSTVQQATQRRLPHTTTVFHHHNSVSATASPRPRPPCQSKNNEIPNAPKLSDLIQLSPNSIASQTSLSHRRHRPLSPSSPQAGCIPWPSLGLRQVAVRSLRAPNHVTTAIPHMSPSPLTVCESRNSFFFPAWSCLFRPNCRCCMRTTDNARQATQGYVQ